MADASITRPVFVRVGDTENQVGEVTAEDAEHATHLVAQLLRQVADAMDAQGQAKGG